MLFFHSTAMRIAAIQVNSPPVLRTPNERNADISTIHAMLKRHTIQIPIAPRTVRGLWVSPGCVGYPFESSPVIVNDMTMIVFTYSIDIAQSSMHKRMIRQG